jgi:hypothetical protein
MFYVENLKEIDFVAIWVKMQHNIVGKIQGFGISFRFHPHA